LLQYNSIGSCDKQQNWTETNRATKDPYRCIHDQIHVLKLQSSNYEIQKSETAVHTVFAVCHFDCPQKYDKSNDSILNVRKWY
jgi:hypothetical protein